MSLDYQRANKEVKETIQSALIENKALQKFSNLKAFVDEAIKNAVIRNFETDQEKSDFLISALFQVRDYLVSENTENSLKLSILNVFHQIEEKVKNEDDQKKREENMTLMQEENQDRNLLTK